MKDLLIVEDDPTLGEGIRLALQAPELRPQLRADGDVLEVGLRGGEAPGGGDGVLEGGADAGELLSRRSFDLLILDINLPDGNGLDLLRALRRESEVPVILLTANDLETDIVAGLELGADDYITKPFNPLELVARVKTQLRRYLQYNPSGGGAAEPEEYDIRGLQISKATHKCLLFGEELSLTPLEFSILWHLCAHQGEVVSSEALFEAVWGERYMDSNNTVMSHIARLREKMHENSRKPKFIKTVWGVGYTIE